ncbi:MAG TPA: rhodanese-like domain-containing protein [Nitrososphaeraceae archaeon]|nr:rhodanese-like domain-containing protein [Nitrososphaeraceae archaeon]
MVYKITSKELQGRKDEFMIIDVREADELEEEGKIDGAVNMPLGQLIRKARHGDLNDLKGKKICTYCSSGYRGNIAADELNKHGFDAVTIEGGYSAWKEEEEKKEEEK